MPLVLFPHECFPYNLPAMTCSQLSHCGICALLWVALVPVYMMAGLAGSRAVAVATPLHSCSQTHSRPGQHCTWCYWEHQQSGAIPCRHSMAQHDITATLFCVVHRSELRYHTLGKLWVSRSSLATLLLDGTFTAPSDRTQNLLGIERKCRRLIQGSDTYEDQHRNYLSSLLPRSFSVTM